MKYAPFSVFMRRMAEAADSWTRPVHYRVWGSKRLVVMICWRRNEPKK